MHYVVTFQKQGQKSDGIDPAGTTFYANLICGIAAAAVASFAVNPIDGM